MDLWEKLGWDQRLGCVQEPIKVSNRLQWRILQWRITRRVFGVSVISLISITISLSSLFLLMILILSCFHWNVKPVLSTCTPKPLSIPQHVPCLFPRKTKNKRKKKSKSFPFTEKKMKNPVKPRYNSCLEVLVSVKKLINFLGFFLQFVSKQPQQRKTQLRFEETNTESEMGFKWSDQRNPEIWDSCIAKNNKIWMRKIQKKKKKRQHCELNDTQKWVLCEGRNKA